MDFVLGKEGSTDKNLKILKNFPFVTLAMISVFDYNILIRFGIVCGLNRLDILSIQKKSRTIFDIVTMKR
jgi:hypothetical protein